MKVYWYAPEKIFLDFKNPLDNPSFRLRCYSIHQELIKEGVESYVVHNIDDIIDPDIVILMSFGEEEYSLAKWLKDNDKVILHDYCENIRGFDILEKTKKLCNYLICASTYLAEVESINYPDKTVIIRDPIEESEFIKNWYCNYGKPRAFYLGMGGNAEVFRDILKPLVDNSGYDYIEISDRKEAEIKWDNNWRRSVISCDVALCPQFEWDFPAKSNVKVTTAIGLGIPVIASPIKSYLEIIDNGYNGYISYSLEDWSNYLEKLKDAELRRLIALNALEKVKYYRISHIYGEWLKIFKKSLGII